MCVCVCVGERVYTFVSRRLLVILASQTSFSLFDRWCKTMFFSPSSELFYIVCICSSCERGFCWPLQPRRMKSCWRILAPSIRREILTPYYDFDVNSPFRSECWLEEIVSHFTAKSFRPKGTIYLRLVLCFEINRNNNGQVLEGGGLKLSFDCGRMLEGDWWFEVDSLAKYCICSYQIYPRFRCSIMG